jgi:hypothetical protein
MGLAGGESLTIHLRSKGSWLRLGEGLTVRLRGKGTTGSGLGAQGA